MIFSENRYALFRIMLWRSRPHPDPPPRFDSDIRRWPRAPDVVIAGKT
jgi:hypothetical protein